MDNIFTEIIDWVNNKPIFWQHAVYRILTKSILEENDIIDLVKFCKIEFGLIKQKIPNVDLNTFKDSISNSAFDSEIIIRKIKNVENIKALKEGEEIIFNDKEITAIYGDNGSGKSSYVGILKHVCKTRGTLPSITKNLHNPNSTHLNQKAEVEYMKDGITGTVEWKDNNISSSILKVVDVFDAHSASHYIGEEDEIAFMPSGLLVLEKLAFCCKKIKQQIDNEISILENNVFNFSFLIEDETEVSKFLKNINHETTINDLRKYSKFTEDNQKELEKINIEIEQLRGTDPKQLIEENNNKIKRFKILKEKYEQIENAFSNEKIDLITKNVNEYNELEKAIDEISKNTFSDLPIEGIGNTTWKHLWESARKFIDEIKGENVFPETDENAICPLCLQILDADAKKRFLNFEEYVKQDIQSKFDAKSEELNKEKQRYKSLDLNFNSIIPTIDEINEINKQFKESHNNYLTSVSDYKNKIVKFIDNRGKQLEYFTFDKLLSKEANKFINELQEENKRLGSQSVNDRLNELTKQKNELEARKNLKKYKPLIAREICRRRKIYLLKECLLKCNTKSITDFSNSLSKKYVTASLQDNFKNELINLGFSYVQINPETRGERGKQYFYLKLGSEYAISADLKEILSEGEHRAISLATFMAELSLSENKSAIIFDDPVSSLDHKWRNKIAKRIVEEAKTRQVIIFTHDITFLIMLQEHAESLSVDIELKSLTRKIQETGLVAENPPWDALSVKKRIGILKNEKQKLEVLKRNATDEQYKEAVKSFYGKLRETWERAVEEVVLNDTIKRFGREIQTQRLKKVIDLTEDDYKIIEKNIKKASKYFSGHDTAGELIEEYPDVDEINDDIEIIENFVKKIRKRRNS
jgi:ABC-type lipoprotein export system ATPase subunit